MEDGKLGVEVIVDPGTDNYTGTTIVSTMPSNRQDIYFTQNVTYSYAVQQGVLADITDIVTEKFDTVDLGEGEPGVQHRGQDARGRAQPLSYG